MTKLLIDEPPLQVLPTLAVRVGLNEAIIVQQLHWLLRTFESRVVTLDNGVSWLRADMAFWESQFPFWGEATIKRAFAQLRERDIVKTRRGKESNVYAIDYAALADQSDPGQGSKRSVATDQSDPRNSSKRELLEEGRRTAATSAADDVPLPGMEAPAAPQPERDELDELVNDVWNHYVKVFGDRLRVKTITPSRRTMLRKGINAVGRDVPLCKRAIDGLKSYRDTHPEGSSRVDLGTVFATGPHDTKSLTDKIEGWAELSTSVLPGGHSKVPIDLTGVPSVMRGTIHNRRSWVKEMYDDPDDEFVERRGQEALDWLRDQCGHEPIVQDGRVTGWREVAA